MDLKNGSLGGTIGNQVSHKTKKAVIAGAITTYILRTPEEGFEPTTNGLTVHCSTAELFRIRDGTIVMGLGNFLQ